MATQKAGAKPASPKKSPLKTKKPAPPKKAAGTSAPAKVVEPDPAEVRQAVFEGICDKIAEGNSLRSICAEDGMPSMRTVMRWLADDGEGQLRQQYARAHEARAETMGEELLAIADEECTMVKADKHGAQGDSEGMVEVAFDATAVARNRLRVDARKWLMSKMAPKKYGDKLQAEHSGPDGAPIAIQSVVTFVEAPARPEDDE